MEELEIVKKLLEVKSGNCLSDEDNEKIKVIRDLLNIPNCFFQIDFVTAIGILDYLGVPKNDIQSLYEKLISPSSFGKQNEKVTISNEK